MYFCLWFFRQIQNWFKYIGWVLTHIVIQHHHILWEKQDYNRQTKLKQKYGCKCEDIRLDKNAKLNPQVGFCTFWGSILSYQIGSRWWLNKPIWNICLSNFDHFPKTFGMKNQEIFEKPEPRLAIFPTYPQKNPAIQMNNPLTSWFISWFDMSFP